MAWRSTWCLTGGAVLAAAALAALWLRSCPGKAEVLKAVARLRAECHALYAEMALAILMLDGRKVFEERGKK